MVAATAEIARADTKTGAFARLADRWIYVFMAALFVVTALVGFIPDSIGVLATVEAGQRPPLPPILHAHAVLMGSWLLLLLAQTTLMAMGHSALHKKLGLIALVLAPLLVAAMIGVVQSAVSRLAAIPAGAIPAEALIATKNFVSNVLLEQIRTIVLFAGFIGWALLIRKKDPETHKRLMILATLIPLPAAIDRITWLPNTLPDSPVAADLYLLLLLAPVLIYEIARRGRVHRAYLIGIGLNLPFMIAAYLLWGTPWWLATAPRILGVQAW